MFAVLSLSKISFSPIQIFTGFHNHINYMQNCSVLVDLHFMFNLIGAVVQIILVSMVILFVGVGWV